MNLRQLQLSGAPRGPRVTQDGRAQHGLGQRRRGARALLDWRGNEVVLVSLRGCEMLRVLRLEVSSVHGGPGLAAPTDGAVETLVLVVVTVASVLQRVGKLLLAANLSALQLAAIDPDFKFHLDNLLHTGSVCRKMFYQDGSKPEFSVTVGTSRHLAVVVITQGFVKLKKVLSGLYLIDWRLQFDLLWRLADCRLWRVVTHGRLHHLGRVEASERPSAGREAVDVAGLCRAGQRGLAVRRGCHAVTLRPGGGLEPSSGGEVAARFASAATSEQLEGDGREQ